MGLSTASWLHYLNLIGKEKVPARPIAHSAVHGLALMAAAAALPTGGPLGWGLAAGGASMSAFFFYLLTQAALPDGEIKVGLGDPLPELEARSFEGQAWTGQALGGHRTLFKVFRGSW